VIWEAPPATVHGAHDGSPGQGYTLVWAKRGPAASTAAAVSHSTRVDFFDMGTLLYIQEATSVPV
jgi:hypothetical protein